MERDQIAPGDGANDLGCWVLPDDWCHTSEVGDRVAVAWAGYRQVTPATVVGHHNETGAAIVRPDSITVAL